MAECELCDPNLGPILSASEHWRAVLNRNQNLLGKCFVAMRRHVELLEELSPAEWMDLREQVALIKPALRGAFQPDHFNYAFLQNQERHVHLHVIPRYAGPRTFGDRIFEDRGWPSHYAVSEPTKRLPGDEFARLAEILRLCLARQS